MTIFDEETEKAKLYRDNWDAKIRYRADQLRRLAGLRDAFSEVWAGLLPVYSPFNYVEGEEQVDFFTPFDVSDDPAISESRVRLPNTTHAGEER
jgi:hypothetical protein